MTVPVGLRGENLSTVFTDAMELLAVCIRTNASSKQLPRKLTREVGERLVEQARRVMHAVYSASAASGDASRREKHCDEAEEAMDCLNAELHLCFLHFRLKAAKAKEISTILSGLQDKFRYWRKGVR